MQPHHGNRKKEKEKEKENINEKMKGKKKEGKRDKVKKKNKKSPVQMNGVFWIRQRPRFPGRLQPSIFGTAELNYCVRDGNRCGLSAIAAGMGESALHLQNCIRNS